MNFQFFSKVVLCGSSTVGKTTIFSRIVNNHADLETKSTTGASFASVQYEYQNQVLNINLWDTAGQEEYRSLVNIYFRESNAVLIIFDLTNHKSFEDVDVWIDQIYANCGEPLPAIIIVGNKSDLEDLRQVPQEEINIFSQNSKLPYYEVSAITGENINLLMENVAAISFKSINLAKTQSKSINKIVDIKTDSNSKLALAKDNNAQSDFETRKCC